MPLAPPVIKIVLLVSLIIKYLLSYVTIYKSHSTSTRRLRTLMGPGQIGFRMVQPPRIRCLLILRTPPERLPALACSQALYQAIPPPTSAQEKGARGRS